MSVAASPKTPSVQRVALHGGPPIRRQMLPYGQHAVSPEDIQAVVAVLRSDRLTTGPQVPAFEEAFAQAMGARGAVAFSSGTAALHAAVFAAGLEQGDEAVTSPLTFCATANCLLYQGAAPVFADVRRDTLTLDPQAAAARLSPRTKAILPVDYAGHPADLEAFMRLAAARGLIVIEDATHAPGAWSGGRRVGSISHMSVFSFHPVKHLTTAEGGMVTTDDAGFVRRLRLFRHHGMDLDRTGESSMPWQSQMIELGYNYRLSDVGCALGASQLQRLEATVARRAQIAARYTEALQSLPWIQMPSTDPEVRHAWHFYPIRVMPERLRADRAELMRALRAEGIGVTVHFLPVPHQPYYRRRFGDHDGAYPVAEDASARLISLPVFPSMSEQDIADVIEAVRKVFTYYAR